MTQHIYFLGIGGTLMGSLALLARESGLRVSGSDKALYPPMSDQLAAADITVYEGFDPAQLNPAPDLVVIGNAQLPRGHAGIEYVLDHGIAVYVRRRMARSTDSQRPLGARGIGHARQDDDGEHARAHSRSRRVSIPDF